MTVHPATVGVVVAVCAYRQRSLRKADRDGGEKRTGKSDMKMRWVPGVRGREGNCVCVWVGRGSVGWVGEEVDEVREREESSSKQLSANH